MDELDPDVTFSPLPAEDTITPSFGEYFEAAAGNVIRDSPTSSFVRGVELSAAEHGVGRYGRWTGPQPRPTRTPMAAQDASARAKAAGVEVDFGDGPTTVEAAAIMIDRAKRRKVRDTKIAEYSPGMGTQLGVSLLVSLADPINIGSAFIPFVGEARYGALLASASGFGGRTAVRAGLGAAEGLAGAALVEPIIAEAATQEGRDYTLAESLRNLAFGTVFGAGLHAVGGGVAEKLFKRQYANTPIQTPGDVVHRLPPEINEAAFRAAISDMIHGRPVASSDVIDLFMKNDPEAARSISYAATLRRDGPEIEDTLNRVEWWKERLDGKPSRPAGEDFMTWLRNKGGLKDDAGILEADIGGKPDLPSTVYISAKGAKQAKRGVSFDELLAEAISQGFVTNRRQFLDALRAGQRSSPTRKQYRLSDEELIAADVEWRQHMDTLLADSGVNKNANKIVKARAIVGREQHLIAAERARISQAVDKMLTREAEYRKAAEGGTVTPPKPFKPEPVKPVTATEEPIAVGDTVNIVSGEEKLIATPKPVKVTRILDDPVYGTYGFIEGSETGFPIKDFVRVGEPAAKPAPDAAKPQAQAETKSFEAWQGSPHDFEKFDSSKIGTGEGAQAFGHGLYFAENRKVAEGYRTTLSGGKDKGFLYRVKINIDPEHLIDWDAPFSKQSEYVKAALRKLGIDENSERVMSPDLKEWFEKNNLSTSGVGDLLQGVTQFIENNKTRKIAIDLQDAQKKIQDTKSATWAEDYARYQELLAKSAERPPMDFKQDRVAAAEELKKVGIEGVRYFDAGSRKRQEGTRNIVVFDDSKVEITGKNDVDVAPKPPIVEPIAKTEAAESTYTQKQITKALNTSIKAGEGKPVPIERILTDYLPGMSKNKFRAAIKEMQKYKPNLVLRKDQSGAEVVFFGKMSKEQAEKLTKDIYDNKINAARRVMEDTYPGLTEVSEFPARVMFSGNMRTRFEINDNSLVTQLNNAAKRGEVSFRTEEGKARKTITADDFYPDDRKPDLLIKFHQPITDKPLKPATRAEALGEIPVKEEPANVPPAPQRVVETPPADREALNTAELDKATAQYTQLRQQTERRLNAMLTQLPPETAATIKAQLARIEDDAASLENLYNTAVQCLLKPV